MSRQRGLARGLEAAHRDLGQCAQIARGLLWGKECIFQDTLFFMKDGQLEQVCEQFCPRSFSSSQLMITNVPIQIREFLSHYHGITIAARRSTL